MNCVIYQGNPNISLKFFPKSYRDSWVCLGEEEEEGFFSHVFSVMSR